MFKAFSIRLESRAIRLGGLVGCVMLAALCAAHPARAGGPTTASAMNGETLVRGGAPLPDLRLDSLNDLGTMPLALPGANTGDLSISLTAPDNSMLHLLFSPRPQFGISVDPDTGTGRSFAGFAWNVFDFSGVSGNFGLAGSLTQPGAQDPNRHMLGPPLALHSTLELGYQFGAENSLSLSLDHATTPDFLNDRDNNNIRLRYGLHF